MSDSNRTEARNIDLLSISKAQNYCFSFISKLLIRKEEDKNMKTWISELKSIDNIRKHCSIIQFANITVKVRSIQLYRQRNKKE
jgi:hypothetical protein